LTHFQDTKQRNICTVQFLSVAVLYRRRSNGTSGALRGTELQIVCTPNWTSAYIL